MKMGLVVAFVATSLVVFQDFIFVLHFQDNNCKSQMKMTQPSQKKSKVGTTAQSSGLWFDVQDENGVWRVGFCERREPMYKVISLDGFHPSHTSFYCEHTQKVLQVRTKTMGLTVPEGRTIRSVLNIKQIEQVCGKMSLFQLIANQLDNTPQKIRIFIRTELLIFIDKVFNTPFEVLANIKLIDIHINKLFMVAIEYYFKLLESSKRFMSLLDSSQTANQLYRATYQMGQIMAMVLGVDKRSKGLYEHPDNRTIRCEAILDYFVKYQGGGILPFKLFFKNLCTLKNVEKEDLTICLQTIYLFISLCEKYQGDFIDGKAQSLSRIILDEIINLIKVFCQKNKETALEFKGKVQLISRIETLYFKLFPNKECSLRKFIEGQKDNKNFLKELENVKSIARMKSEFQLFTRPPPRSLQKQKDKEKDKQAQKQKQKDSEKVIELEQKMKKLQKMIEKMQVVNIHGKEVLVQNKKEEPQPVQPTQNMGQEAFLGSLEWALDAGDIATCKKLVSWRRSLLKLGRITGWEIALAVGMKTFKSKQIHPQDIIEANYEYIIKVSEPKQ